MDYRMKNNNKAKISKIKDNIKLTTPKTKEVTKAPTLGIKEGSKVFSVGLALTLAMCLLIVVLSRYTVAVNPHLGGLGGATEESSTASEVQLNENSSKAILSEDTMQGQDTSTKNSEDAILSEEDAILSEEDAKYLKEIKLLVGETEMKIPALNDGRKQPEVSITDTSELNNVTLSYEVKAIDKKSKISEKIVADSDQLIKNMYTEGYTNVSATYLAHIEAGAYKILSGEKDDIEKQMVVATLNLDDEFVLDVRIAGNFENSTLKYNDDGTVKSVPEKLQLSMDTFNYISSRLLG